MDSTQKKLQKIFSKIDKLTLKGKENALEYSKYIDDVITQGDYAYFEQCLYYYYDINTSKYTSIVDVKNKTWNDILFQTKTPFLKKLSLLYKKKNVYQEYYNIYSMSPNVLQINLSSPLDTDYSILSASQSISFTIINNEIKVNIINSNTNKVNIYKSTWVIINGVDTPTSTKVLHSIEISASQSSYHTEIPVTHPEQYLVTTYERSPYKVYNYKLLITKDSLLGQIKEVETYPQDPSYLLRNKQLAALQQIKKVDIEVTKAGATFSSIISNVNPNSSYDNNLFINYSSALDILLS
jgi:hypothetical protein